MCSKFIRRPAFKCWPTLLYADNIYNLQVILFYVYPFLKINARFLSVKYSNIIKQLYFAVLYEQRAYYHS